MRGPHLEDPAFPFERAEDHLPGLRRLDYFVAAARTGLLATPDRRVKDHKELAQETVHYGLAALNVVEGKPVEDRKDWSDAEDVG